MNITLNVSERTLRAIYSEMLGEYEAAEQAVEAAAQRVLDAQTAHGEATIRFGTVKNDMATIKRALSPVVQMGVRSESYPDTVYTVSIDTANGNRVTCDCQSFRFERGLKNGTCKHIRYALNNGLLDRI